MSTVRVEQAHTGDRDTAKKALDGFAADISKFGMRLEWRGYEADLKGTGASGNVSVTADKVVVTVKLGMVAKLAGVDPVRLEGSISKRLKAALEPPIS